MERSLKHNTLLGPRDLARLRGLEIGPRDNPILRKPAYDIRYVDFAPTQTIQANAVAHSLKAEDVVDVDIILGEIPLRDCVEAPVDYLLAAYVVEHVPDLIGWLNALHGALVEGGTLGGWWRRTGG